MTQELATQLYYCKQELSVLRDKLCTVKESLLFYADQEEWKALNNNKLNALLTDQGARAEEALESLSKL